MSRDKLPDKDGRTQEPLKGFLIALAIAGGICVTGAAACAWTFYQAWSPPAVTTETTAYSRLLRDWSATGLTDGFPKKIPNNATEVSLSAYPGFMQGSGWFQLRMKLPAKEVAAIQARTAAKAERTCPDECTGSIESPLYWNVPRLLAGEPSERRFPPDFVVYALETDGDWNHSTGQGVAVSTTRNEVVYWADP